MSNTSKRKALFLKKLASSKPVTARAVRLSKAQRKTAFKESRNPSH
jgi:hypothetical protein